MKTLVFCVLLATTMLHAADGGEPPEVTASSERARREAQRVMNAGLPFAESSLAEHGEFAPFGAVMLPDGLIQSLTPGDAPDAPAEALYTRLTDGLRRGAAAGEYDVVATFVLVELAGPADDTTMTAVHVALEHRDGYCADVFYPTSVKDGKRVLGEAFAVARSGTFFDVCR